MKSPQSMRLRVLLGQRRNLKRKFIDLSNGIRHTLRSFGVKLGAVSPGRFAKAVEAAVAGDPMLEAVMAAMLTARAALWAQMSVLHKLVAAYALKDEVCRRFMEIPGVGPVIVAERGQGAQLMHWKVAGICRTLASYAAGGWGRRPSVRQAKPALEALAAVRAAGLLGEDPNSTV